MSDRSSQVSVPAGMPDTCDGKEQEAFEAYAVKAKHDMACHPLHYLFLNERTDAARQAWKAAINYCREQVAAAPSPTAGAAEPPAEGEREAFERWADRRFGPAPIPQTERFASYWEAWQAALAARPAEGAQASANQQGVNP